MRCTFVAAVVLVGLVRVRVVLVFGGVSGVVFGVGLVVLVVGAVQQMLLPPGYCFLFHGLVMV